MVQRQEREHSQELLRAAKGFVSVEGGRGNGLDTFAKNNQELIT